jgi:UDP-4-amino-4-deoxy-L-arabinose formyltransferase/UDP-glucuronic acid dehydrogenase (UDP-4-keto-hexauronic acid decarboxylating)
VTRAVVYAYHGFGVCALESLVRQGVDVVQVVSHRDQPGERCWWPAVAAWCEAHAVPCLLDPDLGDPAVVARLQALAPDLVLSAYFRALLPDTVLAAPLGAWNLHGSLLPRFRGRAPINWQLVHGERRSGLTLHRMVRRADAGEILAQVAVDVHPDQDAFGLTRQLLAVTPDLLDRALADLLAGRARPVAQDDRAATVFPGRRPGDGRIDWSWPARRIHNLVRAVAPPWPGAFAFSGAERLLVRRTAVADEDGQAALPGTVLADGSIACAAGRLWILDAAHGDDDAPVLLAPGLRLS